MATDDNLCEVVFACYRTNIACATAVLSYLINQAKTEASKRIEFRWEKKYLALRPQFGAYATLMPDLLELDNTKFCNYIHMDSDIFEELFIGVRGFKG